MNLIFIIVAIFCLTGFNALQNNGRCSCTDASASSCVAVTNSQAGDNMFSCHRNGGGSGQSCTCSPFTSPTLTVTFNTGCTGASNKLKVEVAGGTINYDAVDTVTFEWNDGSTSDLVDTSLDAVYTPLSDDTIFNGTARLELADGFSYTITDNDLNTLNSTSSDIDTTAVEGCTQQIADQTSYNSVNGANLIFYPLPRFDVTYAHLTLVSGPGGGGGGGGGGDYPSDGVGQRGGGGGSGGVVVYNITIPSAMSRQWLVYIGKSILSMNTVFDWNAVPNNGLGGAQASTSNTDGSAGNDASANAFAAVSFNTICKIYSVIIDDDVPGCFDLILTGGGPGVGGKGGVNGDVPTFANGGENAYLFEELTFASWDFGPVETSFSANGGADGLNRITGGTGGAATYSDAGGNNAGVSGGDGGRGVGGGTPPYDGSDGAVASAFGRLIIDWYN